MVPCIRYTTPPPPASYASNPKEVRHVEKAGFWVRAIALIVDGVVVGVVSSIIASVLLGGPGNGSGLTTVLGIAYYLYFWTPAGGGQTLGMRLFNLKVVKSDGSALTYGGAFIRYVML